jgi:flagellar protein FlaG
MSMEISNVTFDTQAIVHPIQERAAVQPTVQPVKPEPESKPSESDPSMATALVDLYNVSLLFNRRLQFSVNTKLDEVVVKVIDEETDTVIKEIPPRELQLVHERIREAIGILFDEKI